MGLLAYHNLHNLIGCHPDPAKRERGLHFQAAACFYLMEKAGRGISSSSTRRQKLFLVGESMSRI